MDHDLQKRLSFDPEAQWFLIQKKVNQTVFFQIKTKMISLLIINNRLIQIG